MNGSNILPDLANDTTGAELRQFIERIEAERCEQAESKAREKEIFAEMKSRGYMTRPIRTIIKQRAMDSEKRAEEEAFLSLYKAALGME